MASPHALFETLTIVLGTAAVTTILFQRLKQPVVLGYLVAGLIVGPHVPIPLHADEGMTRALSELGVILLMFALGLEFSLGKLLRVGPRAGFIAVVQSSLMVWLGFAVGRIFGWTVLESLYAGGIIAISSTTIIVKAFEELNVRGRFKETVFGVLIVEDLIAILLMTVFTTLSSGEELSAKSIALTAGRLAAFLAALLTVGLVTVPRLIRLTLRLGRPETTVVVAMGICFFCARLAEGFGYSVALGAFMAGALIAESGEEKHVERLIVPVRDVFGAVFFVSVGMLIDPRLIARNWLPVLVFTAAVVIGKLVFVSIASFLTGTGIRRAVQTGMSLAQIGEFSFIIAGLGLSLGATRDFLYPVAVAVSALTTLLTPWLIRAADPVASWADDELPRVLKTFVTLYGSWIERLGSRSTDPTIGAQLRRRLLVLLLDTAVGAGIVIGASVAKDHLASRLVARTGLSPGLAAAAVVAATAVLVLPLAIGAVRSAHRLGYLLAVQSMPRTGPEKVDLAAAPRRALIVMLQLAIVSLLGAPLLAVTQPFIPPFYGALALAAFLAVLGVRFWRSAAELHGHVRAATQIIAEALAEQARKGGAGEPLPSLEDVSSHLPGLGTPTVLRLHEGSHAAGRSLEQLQVRGRTGATVLLLKRGDARPVVPSATELLADGDVLALAGSDEAIAAAATLLEKGEEPLVRGAEYG
jgi:CPA2 family monovalent cation:H+ antiporter-2